VIYAHLEEEPPSLASLRPGLTRDLDAVIAKAMAKAQDERHGSCAELIAAARAAVGEDAAPPSTGATPAPLVPALKVLIADRDAAVRTMIRVSLNAGRFEVLEADDGRKALELVRRELPVLVFLDWGLTEVSGPELCQALRADARTAPTKIVALAGRAEALDDRAARAAGADEYIAKPFSSLQLLYRVGDLLDQELVSG
jgi:CheY-like chemotaxis protein